MQLMFLIIQFVLIAAINGQGEGEGLFQYPPSGRSNASGGLKINYNDVLVSSWTSNLQGKIQLTFAASENGGTSYTSYMQPKVPSTGTHAFSFVANASDTTAWPVIARLQLVSLDNNDGFNSNDFTITSSEAPPRTFMAAASSSLSSTTTSNPTSAPTILISSIIPTIIYTQPTISSPATTPAVTSSPPTAAPDTTSSSSPDGNKDHGHRRNSGNQDDDNNDNNGRNNHHGGGGDGNGNGDGDGDGNGNGNGKGHHRNNGLSTGAIIGITVGVICFGLLILIPAALYSWRRRRLQRLAAAQAATSDDTSETRLRYQPSNSSNRTQATGHGNGTMRSIGKSGRRPSSTTITIGIPSERSFDMNVPSLPSDQPPRYNQGTGKEVEISHGSLYELGVPSIIGNPRGTVTEMPATPLTQTITVERAESIVSERGRAESVTGDRKASEQMDQMMFEVGTENYLLERDIYRNLRQ
ncbi:MAG: hypothetical protein M1820_002750 [Bogoriella megaspora]|nr:MAG: hypothetical protein M1820_002750 [Bogoriella megaspora]